MPPMTKSQRVVKKMMTVFKNSIAIHDQMNLPEGQDEAYEVRKPLVTKFMALFNSPDLSADDKSHMLVHMLDRYDEYAEQFIREIIYTPEFLLTASHLIALMLADPNVHINATNDDGESTTLRIWKFADDHEVLNNTMWMPSDHVDKLVADGQLSAADAIGIREENAEKEKKVVIKRALLARTDVGMLALQSDDGDLVEWLFEQYVEEFAMCFIKHPNFNVDHPEYGAKEFLAYATKYERHTAINLLNDLLNKHEGEKENALKK